MQIFRIYNQGQIPAIASGYRTLVAKEGRKVVQVIDWTTLDAARVPMQIWRSMKPEPVDYNWRKVKRAIKAALRYNQKTKFIREILSLEV